MLLPSFLRYVWEGLSLRLRALLGSFMLVGATNSGVKGVPKGYTEPAATEAAPESAKEQQSLYERLGGATAVQAAVNIFYNKIMADSELAPFFEGIDMAKQRRKQIAFMEFAFGGSKHYSGRALGAVHRKLIQDKGLKEPHFDMVAGHLVDTLVQLKVPKNLIDEVVAVVTPTKAMIFGGAA